MPCLGLGPKCRHTLWLLFLFAHCLTTTSKISQGFMQSTCGGQQRPSCHPIHHPIQHQNTAQLQKQRPGQIQQLQLQIPRCVCVACTTGVCGVAFGGMMVLTCASLTHVTAMFGQIDGRCVAAAAKRGHAHVLSVLLGDGRVDPATVRVGGGRWRACEYRCMRRRWR